MTTREDPKTEPSKAEPNRRGMMQSLTALCVRYVERLMPDPYLFAVILTLIVAALVAVLVSGASPSGMLKAWYGGVWGSQNIFTFAFQMVLILVTGYTLAEAPVLKRGIVHIAGKPGIGPLANSGFRSRSSRSAFRRGARRRSFSPLRRGS